MKILLKLSGEVFSLKEDVLCTNKIYEIVSMISLIRQYRHSVGVVVGGGNIIRGKDWQKTQGYATSSIDFSGMLATIINAQVLKFALDDKQIPTIVHSNLNVGNGMMESNMDTAVKLFSKGYVVVFAGGLGVPGLSTDVAAALNSSLLGVDVFIKMTKVDGVYSQDPLVDTNAHKFDAITLMDAISKDLKVIDSEALCILKNNNIKTIVTKNGLNYIQKILHFDYSCCTVMNP